MPDENLDLGDFDLNIETSHEPTVEKKKTTPSTNTRRTKSIYK